MVIVIKEFLKQLGPLKVFVFLSLLTFYGSFLIYQIDLPAGQDLPRQIKNGEMILQGQFDVLTKNVYSYIEPDHAFANHHWLSGVVFYLLYQAIGWDGLVIFKVVFFLLVFSLLFFFATKKADFWLVVCLAVPTILVLLGRTSLRPEVFSYFLIVVFLYLLADLEEFPKHRRIFWLVPAQLLWGNLHLFFPIGVMLVAGVLAEKVIFNYRSLASNLLVKKLSLVFILLLGVSFINPYGVSGIANSLKVNLTQTEYPVVSAENNSVIKVLESAPVFDDIPVSTFPIAAGILVLSFFFGFERKPIFYLLASLGTLVIGFSVVRSLPFFCLIFLPAASQNFNDIFLKLKIWCKQQSPAAQKFISYSLLTALALFLIYVAVFYRERIVPNVTPGVGVTRDSDRSAEFFKQQGIAGPILNDTDIGSYLIYHLYPQEKVFSDNRFGDAYSADFFTELYLPILGDENRWQEVLEQYQFNAIFTYHYSGRTALRDFLHNRIFDREWVWVYADSYAIILVRNIPANQAVIDQFKISPKNIGQRLSYLSESEDFNDQIAAADLFNLASMDDLARAVYFKVLDRWPKQGRVWLALARSELRKSDEAQSDPVEALGYLEKALQYGWKTSETYSYLALAYYRTGQLEKAEEAVRQELKLDPDSADGKNWLKILAEAKFQQ